MVERVILHVGTEKTGSTALQYYMRDRRNEHAAAGVFYPATPGEIPFHKWLTKPLIRAQPQVFIKGIEQAIASAPSNTKTVFLSQEGIHGGWIDFPEYGREGLRLAAQCFPLEIWVWFRDPLGYMVSLYVEMLRKPLGNPDWVRSRSLEEMLSDPRFLFDFDYTGFVASIEALVAPRKVVIHPYTGFTVRDAMAALYLEFDGQEPRHREALSMAAVTQIKHLNKLNISPEAHAAALSSIIATDDRSRPAFAASLAARRVAQQLEDRHGGMRTWDGRPLVDCWRTVEPSVKQRTKELEKSAVAGMTQAEFHAAVAQARRGNFDLFVTDDVIVEQATSLDEASQNIVLKGGRHLSLAKARLTDPLYRPLVVADDDGKDVKGTTRVDHFHTTRKFGNDPV